MYGKEREQRCTHGKGRKGASLRLGQGVQFAAASSVASRAHMVPLDERFHHGRLAAFDGGEQRPQDLLVASFVHVNVAALFTAASVRHLYAHVRKQVINV
jgi:hypothetical protein